MPDIFSQNLLHFEKRSAPLADFLKKSHPDPLLEMTTAASGDFTAKKRFPNRSHRFIHSRIDPKQEARIWAENQGIVMPCLVIMGIGLAYHVFELLKKCKTIENAYLIEADARMFQSAVKAVDFSSLIQNPVVHFIIGSPPDDIEKRLFPALVQPFSRHIFSPIVSLRPDLYDPLKKTVENHLCDLRLNPKNNTDSLQNNRPVFAQGIVTLLNQMCMT